MSIKQTLENPKAKQTMKLTYAFLFQKLYLLQLLSSVRNRNTLKQFWALQPSKSVSKVSNKRGSYTKYSEEERLKIGKYCNENGVSIGLRKFKESFANLTEITARTLGSKDEKDIKIADKEEPPAGAIVAQKRGRPLLFGISDHMVQNYLKVSSNCILLDIMFGHPTVTSKTLKDYEG